MSTALARQAMVARLVAEGRLDDPRLREAFLSVPRHRFLPPEVAHRGYDAAAIELIEGQTLTCPDFVALMVSLLDVQPGHRVLEVGTGSGYQAAILAALGAQVTTLEVRPALHALGTRNLVAAGFADVDARLADGTLGAPDVAPFDGIVVACATPAIPDAWRDQLAPGGRLVAPLGDPARLQTLACFERTAAGLSRRDVRAAWFVPMWGLATA